MHQIGGDFNFLSRRDFPIRISTENFEIPMNGNDTRATNQANAKWNAMLSNAMEHHQPNQPELATTPTPMKTQTPTT